MKVELRKAEKVDTFGNLKCGDCFTFEDVVYMKIEDKVSYKEGRSYITVNAIDSDGITVVFDDYEEVRPKPNAKWILE